MLTNTTHSKYAKAAPLSWNAVKWTDGLWADAERACRDKTVPHLQSMFEAKDISHVLENFRICAGEAEGSFDGTVFGDGDFYKWMEAALYTAAKNGDQAMMDKLDEYIDLIGRAQQPDGYLSTKQIIGEREHNGVKRHGDINDFEVYNFGHMFTTASLHYRITGKDNFLKIAERTADYLDRMYQESARTGEVQTAVCPSHYMGLIELYRTTGEKKYLDLAKLAIQLRDKVSDGTDDNQDRIPLKEHDKIVGHAVRSNYLYAGVTDLYLEDGDEEYFSMLHKVFRSMADKKMYLTGGVGALYNGASPYGNFFIHQLVHQAHGYEYQLPNVTAYNESCANIGSVLWLYRMFLAEPKAEYFDLIERTMLNTNLASISLDGQKYFYENMLRRAKKLDYELIWPLTRTGYIESYCCPPNIARTIAQASEYAYCVSGDTIWMGMYGANRAQVSLEQGTSFVLEQRTEYPYDGRIALAFSNVQGKAFTVQLRIPGWAAGGSICWQGKEIPITKAMSGTYYPVTVEGDGEILLNLAMPARYTTAHLLVEEDTNQAAVERGPLVYCIEGMDAPTDTLDDLMLDLNASFVLEMETIQDRKIPVLKTKMYKIERPDYDPEALYQPLSFGGLSSVDVKMVPYYAWDNRGYDEMKIWLPVAYR